MILFWTQNQGGCGEKNKRVTTHTHMSSRISKQELFSSQSNRFIPLNIYAADGGSKG